MHIYFREQSVQKLHPVDVSPHVNKYALHDLRCEAYAYLMPAHIVNDEYSDAASCKRVTLQAKAAGVC